MARYVSLISWTEQGIRVYKDTLDRAKAAEDLAHKFGGSIVDIYWTLGAYDIVAVMDFPDDESATAFALGQCSLGSIRTQTLRAFGRDEMASIIARASSSALA